MNINLSSNSQFNIRYDAVSSTPVDSGSVSTEPVSNSLMQVLGNTDTSSTIARILDNAGLLSNDRNTEIIAAMMRAGMNVSKNEVLQMVGSLRGLEQEDISIGVTLDRIGISPTVDNIEQYRAYEGFQHQINNAVDDILDMIPKTIDDLTSSGDVQQAIDMSRDILDIFSGQGAYSPVENDSFVYSQMDIGIKEILSDSELISFVDELNNLNIDPEFIKLVSAGDIPLDDVMLVLDYIVDTQATPRDEQFSNVDQSVESSVENSTVEETSKGNVIDDPHIIGADENNLNENQGLILQKQSNTSFVNNEEMLIKKPFEKKLVTFMKSKVYNTLLKQTADRFLKLTPEQVGEKKEVADLYKRLSETTNRMLDVLQNKATEDSPLTKATTELSKNLNFMNELNNMFDYIQLPMRMAQSEAHGELYVYSNKKHLASEDGTVSALLHLDLDHLGATDIYVSMNSSEHVNTHFYLQNDECLDLIEAHIDELNARIEARGYRCDTQVSKREDMANIMTEIVNSSVANIPISLTNFDAKA